MRPGAIGREVHEACGLVGAPADPTYDLVVFTSPLAGRRVTGPGHRHRSASKSGINGSIKTAALGFSGYCTTVDGVEPGNILTNGTMAHRSPVFTKSMADAAPLRWLVTPKDFAMPCRCSPQRKRAASQL
jgi:NAD(P)-dependent dehydrogenase (short-subunit alcohol dehydrogenase family)